MKSGPEEDWRKAIRHWGYIWTLYKRLTPRTRPRKAWIPISPVCRGRWREHRQQQTEQSCSKDQQRLRPQCSPTREYVNRSDCVQTTVQSYRSQNPNDCISFRPASDHSAPWDQEAGIFVGVCATRNKNRNFKTGANWRELVACCVRITCKEPGFWWFGLGC